MSRIDYVFSKIVDLKTAKLKVNSWKMKGDTIVFTNGCFDILHKGHVTYLAKAAEFGHKLVLALNTDASVKKLNKGDNRPVNDENARLQVIASLAFVDLVLLFNEETPFETIEALMPNVLVKGADYSPDCIDKSDKRYIVGSDIIRKAGGEVKVVDLEIGFSTTNIINKLNK
jgi:D-glycero-beta-D-manno-heptose 1-phosphate adenylyltransferase